MQITLKQSHVEAAIQDYIAKAGITFNVDDINFTAGRGKDGLTATVELEDPFGLEPVNKLPTRAKQSKAVEAEQSEPALVEESSEPESDEPASTQETSSFASENEEHPVEEEKEEEKPKSSLLKETKSLNESRTSLFG